MSTDGFRVDAAGLNALMAEIGNKMMALDQELRAEHAGKPAAEIAPQVDAAYKAIGVNLNSESLLAYAAAIESGRDFQIELK